MNDNVSELTKLGSNQTSYIYDDPTCGILECFENKYPNRSYIIEFTTKEFTSCCPKTGQPDFAQIVISYSPDKLCIETKSLKLYLFAFRNYKSFMETITNKILDDLVAVCSPLCMTIHARFNSRGGIEPNVIVKYEK